MNRYLERGMFCSDTVLEKVIILANTNEQDFIPTSAASSFYSIPFSLLRLHDQPGFGIKAFSIKIR